MTLDGQHARFAQVDDVGDEQSEGLGDPQAHDPLQPEHHLVDGMEVRGDAGALDQGEGTRLVAGPTVAGSRVVGERCFEALGRVEPRREQLVGTGEGEYPAQDPKRVGHVALRQPRRPSPLRRVGVLEGPGRYADVALGVAVGARELAVAPPPPHGRQAETAETGGLRQAHLAGTTDGTSRPVWCVAPGGRRSLGVGTADEVQQPFVGHEVGDIGDGLGPGGEPGDEVGLDDAPDPVSSLGAAPAQIVVGGGHPGVGYRRDVGADLGRRRLAGPFGFGRGPGGPGSNGVGDGSVGLHGGDGLGEPRSGLGLAGESLLTSLSGALGRWKARAPSPFAVPDRPGERPAHQLAALRPTLSTVS